MTDAERVLRLLNNANPIFQADMAYVLGLSIRAVQAACEELRRTGYPVLSSGDGVRLGETAKETLAGSASLRKRAITQWTTARALRRTGLRMQTAEDAAERLTLWGIAS